MLMRSPGSSEGSSPPEELRAQDFTGKMPVPQRLELISLAGCRCHRGWHLFHRQDAGATEDGIDFTGKMPVPQRLGQALFYSDPEVAFRISWLAVWMASRIFSRCSSGSLRKG